MVPRLKFDPLLRFQFDIDPTWRDDLADAQMRLEESLSTALRKLHREGVSHVFVVRWTLTKDQAKGTRFCSSGRIFLPEQEGVARSFARQMGGVIEKLTFKEDLCPTTGTGARTSKVSNSTSTCTNAGTVDATSEMDPSLKKTSSARTATNTSTSEACMCSSYPTRDVYVHADQLDACIEQYLRGQKWFRELQASHKENWVPGSKGGYPDYYGG